MKLFLDFRLKRRDLDSPKGFGAVLLPFFFFFGTKVKLNGEKSCVVVVVPFERQPRRRDRHPKNFSRFNFQASFQSELEKILSSSTLDVPGAGSRSEKQTIL